MSTLRVANLQSTAGTQTVTQDRLYRGAATAWVNFNGTGTVAIRDSYNVSSITDNGVGDYTVNFQTALANANYSVVGSARNTSVVSYSITYNESNTSSSARVIGYLPNSSSTGDCQHMNVAIFGGY